MHRPIVIAAAIAVLAAPGGALAQSAAQEPASQQQEALQVRPAAPPSRSDLIGKEVRLRDRDRVIGEITDVLEQDGKPASAVIQVEERNEPVLIDLRAIEQQGGKLMLVLSDQELKTLPVYRGPGSGRNDGYPGDRPHGGITPGWGAPEGGTGQNGQGR